MQKNGSLQINISSYYLHYTTHQNYPFHSTSYSTTNPMKQQHMFTLSCFIFMATANFVESTKNIFILAGQSNMVGVGGVINNKWDGVVPSECQPNPSILRFNDQFLWEEAREPLHQGGIGPGMPFANSVLKRGPNIGEIGLVPCAVAGTRISQWMRGTDLYNRLLSRARAAVSSSGGEIRALLWYQGESDTGSNDDAESYKSRLVQFFSDVRSDLQSPSLLVLQVALASGGDEHYREIVRKAQLETGLQNVKCVDAKGLELLPDGLHLTTAAQVQLGKKLAEAFLHMTNLG